MNLELAARMPWLVAPEQSIWLITGTYPGGGGFTNALAMVPPFCTTENTRIFKMIHPSLQSMDLYGSVAPDRITRGHRLLLVHADDPDRTYDPDEQDFITVHRDRQRGTGPAGIGQAR